MADNTVDLTLKANVADFEQSIKAAIGAFTGQMRAAARTANTQSGRIKAAMANIGVRPFADIEREIRELDRDYKRLAASGELSSRALTQAHVRMREGIGALRSEQNGWLESLTRAQGELLATGAAVAGLVLGLGSAAGAYLRFEDAIAAVNSITELSAPKMAALSEQVRELALDMGRDATESAKALYEILSSGVAPGQGITVLERATRAAVAGITDTKTAARVGLSVINAYGKEIGDLEQVYDVLFQTVKEGVTTLPELSQSLGQVLSIAAGANIPFETLAAAIAQLTLAGLPTSQAISAVRGAIVQLSSPSESAAKAMEKLGITSGNFVESLRQIAALDLGPAALRDIIPDVEGRTAVIALSRDIGGLTGAITNMQNAAGATDAAYDELAATDSQSVKEFTAAFKELVLQLGEFVAAGTPVLEALTGVLKVIGELPGPVKAALVSLTALAGGYALLAGPLGRIGNAMKLATASTGLFGAALRGLMTLPGGVLAGVLGLSVSLVGKLVATMIEANQVTEGLQERFEKFAEAQRKIQKATAAAADTQHLSTEQLQQLTKKEIESYADRLRAAVKYHSSVRDLRSRQVARVQGFTSGTDPQALAAAREARLFRENLAEIKDVLAAREKAAIKHRQSLVKVKQEELDGIRKALAGQVKAFNDANDALESARQQREQVAQAFQALESELQSAPQAPDAELTVLDINRQFGAAQQAFAAGDLTGALDRLERGREIIRALAEQGGVTRQYLIAQTQRLAQLADQVGAAQVSAAEAQAAKARKAIEELVAKAEFLKTIQIGFDVGAAEQSAESLRARLKAILAENPLIVPVQVAKPTGPSAADKRAAELLNIQQNAAGGLIRGPGTGRSDSILSWISNGEYVVRAAAVSRYGTALLDAINHLSLPGFASGGLVDNLRIPSVSAPAPAGATGTPVHLHLGGQSFQVGAAPDVAAALAATVRREALKAGR